MSKISQKSGMTLIEIMIAIGILALIFALGLVFDLSSYKGYSFRGEVSTIVGVLERARSLSLNNAHGTTHGVCFISPNYVIFRGNICDSSVITNELVPANKAVSDASNFQTNFPTIIFSQLSGTTTETTINATDGVKSTTITINYEGTIIW